MTIKVLHVDDSPTERHLLAGQLKGSGYSVTSVASVDEALIQVQRDRPNVVITDVVMPGKNGFQLVKALKRDESTSDILAVILTTRNQETDRIWGMRQGADAYLVKPIGQDALLACLTDILSPDTN